MALSGPRLDRPSIIGDEGRPRATSLGIASLVVAGLVGVSGVLLEWPSLLPSLATLVGLTAAGIALIDRNRFIDLFVGHTILVIFGSPLILLAFVLPFVDRSGLGLSGFIVALFGITITWSGVGDRDGLKRATMATGLSYAAMWGWFVLCMFAIGLWKIWHILSGPETSSPVIAAVSFLFAVGYSVIAVRLSLRWLPIRQLAPRDRRSTVEMYLAAIRRATIVAVVVAVGSLATGVLLVMVRIPPLADAIMLLSSAWIVDTIVIVGTLSLLGGVIAATLRRLTHPTNEASTRRVSAVFAGLALLLLAVVGYLTALPLLVVLVVSILGPLLLTIALAVGLASVVLDVLPDRAGGPAIAATGLVFAAVGLVDGPPALVFACVAGAVLVWDVSSFGLGLTAELGHLPETRRLELFHGLLALCVAAVSILVAVGLDLLRTSVFAGIGGTPALLVIALGALILLIPLRG